MTFDYHGILSLAWLSKTFLFFSDAIVFTASPDADSSSASCDRFPYGCFMIIPGCFSTHCDCQLTARVLYVIFDPLAQVESLINSWFSFLQNGVASIVSLGMTLQACEKASLLLTFIWEAFSPGDGNPMINISL